MLSKRIISTRLPIIIAPALPARRRNDPAAPSLCSLLVQPLPHPGRNQNQQPSAFTETHSQSESQLESQLESDLESVPLPVINARCGNPAAEKLCIIKYYIIVSYIYPV